MRHLLGLLLAGAALAQIPSPNEAGVAMGHLHLFVKDVDAQRKFWVEGLGATPVKLGPNEGVKIPGAIVLFRKSDPSGGTAATTVNHIGVKVRDLKQTSERCVAAGGKIVTKNDKQVLMAAPEDIRVELTVDPEMTRPVENHHIHFYTVSVEDTQAWYVKTFGAKPGKRGPFEAADLPGVNLSFSKADTPPLPTEGRSLDHIGFEVTNLEAFCKKLEASGVKFTTPYRKVEALGIAVAFFVDPWGTKVELTEGLNKL